MAGVPEDRATTVLVVEDEKAIRLAMRRILQDRYRVFLAEGPDEALSVMRSESVDIVLVDYMMPGGTGEEFMRSVARDWPQVRRALVSGTPPDHLDELMREGLVQVFLPKPWNTAELLALLEKLTVAR